MAKLTQAVASLYHFISGLNLGIAKSYFGEVPESFAVPSVFYPTPETDNRGYSTSGYETDSIIFLKVFDKTSMESNYIAQQIVEGIMKARRNIPIYGDDGTPTGIDYHIYKVNSRNLETGVTQIEISYKTQTSYVVPEVTTAQNIYIERLTTKINIEEDEEDGEEDGNNSQNSGENSGES